MNRNKKQKERLIELSDMIIETSKDLIQKQDALISVLKKLDLHKSSLIDKLVNMVYFANADELYVDDSTINWLDEIQKIALDAIEHYASSDLLLDD